MPLILLPGMGCTAAVDERAAARLVVATAMATPAPHDNGVGRTCTFVNETDGTLECPSEMCETMGHVYPLDEPWRCDDSSPAVSGG